MTLEERFWSKVNQSDECWTWTASKDDKGYGKIGLPGRKGWGFAHRVSYSLEHGVELTPDQKVLHRCDNPPCVRPDHLFLGTAADNAADMVAKGRSRGQKVTHCVHGHSLEDAYRYGTKRVCRQCKRNEYLRKVASA